MPCTSPYFDGALFNFMDIAQVEAPIAQLGAPELFGARGKLPPLSAALFAAHIVQCCQQYYSALLYLIPAQ